MHTLATWAVRNKWKARLGIALLWIFLHLAAFVLSVLLLGESPLPEIIVWLLCFSLVAAITARHFAQHKPHFARRKILDAGIAAATFGLLFAGYAEPGARFYQPLQASQANYVADSVEPAARIVPVKKMSVRSKWKQARAYVKLIRKEIRSAEGKNKGLLIAFTVLLGIAALLLVAALACGISCNGGGEGLALAVGVLGASLVIFLMYKVIYRINNGPPKKKPVEGT